MPLYPALLTMGDLTLICPLCCNKIFNSKEALLEHLSTILPNLFCPVCNTKISSFEQLSEHLNLDNCVPIDSVQRIFENAENNEYESEISTPMEYKLCDDGNTNTEVGLDNNLTSLEPDGGNKMQIDLLKCLSQGQDLKIVKEDGENRFMIVSQSHTGLKKEQIVTRQNQDGTMSFTTLCDVKNEDSDIVIELEKDDTLVQEYSCSTCNMSFTSVFDHINTYHTNQDVVVEGNLSSMTADIPVEYETVENEEPTTDNQLSRRVFTGLGLGGNLSSMSEIPVEYETVENEEPTRDNQSSRRVITDTGDIVETPFVETSSAENKQTGNDTGINTLQLKSSKDLLKTGRGGIKRFVQIDKLCDGVITDLKQTDRKAGPCHKVVVAPSLVTPTGETVKTYHCTMCNLYCNQLNDFREHACKPAKYACSQCSVSYDNSKSLCAHMKVHKVKSEDVISEIQETFECETCNTVFLTNKSLKLHKRMHEPIKSRPIDPPRNSLTGQLHRYQCDVCDKMIPDDYRDIHKASHDNDKMLNCAICNKKFSSAEYLEMHMNVHNLEKPAQAKSDKILPYSCIYCDRKFARPHEKVKHERIHTGEKPHECEICGKTFRVSYCLTLHMRTHTGARPYACPHCDKRFKAHSVYNHHLLTHSEVRAYKCPFCPKAFKTSVQLAGHKNSHTKPFACTQCNRPFASLYAVRVHTETHNRQNNLKFCCVLCGASYARAFALKDHVKQVHKQDVDALDPLSGQDGWLAKSAVEDKLDQDPTQEITHLEIQSDEFIVPN